jgi:uncharacterized membrane protein
MCAVPRVESVPVGKRLIAVDALRGLVMALMALDHVRDYFSAAHFEPTDLTKTTPALFFTRWVTHFCAPAFVLLAGMGARLSLNRGKSVAELSRFLWTRGLWLVVLEVTVVRFGWAFNLDYRLVWVQVIWALGISMIVLAGLVHLPVQVSLTFGILMIVGHNALDRIALHAEGPTLIGAGLSDWLWAILHVQRPPIMYPLVPWIGVMALGYALADVLEKRAALLCIGFATTIAFVILRMINLYGDPSPWREQSTGMQTLMAFLNVEKYPPSLAFLLATLGPTIAMLALLDRAPARIVSTLSVIGRVPLFYYIVHIYLVHALAVLAGIALGRNIDELLVPFFMLPNDWGFTLPVVYAVWLLVLLSLYLPCRWFASLKARRDWWWLGYV